MNGLKMTANLNDAELDRHLFVPPANMDIPGEVGKFQCLRPAVRTSNASVCE